MSPAPEPGFSRALAALRWLAGLDGSSPDPDLPRTRDLWALCHAHSLSGGAALRPADAAAAAAARHLDGARNLGREALGAQARGRLADAGVEAVAFKGVALLPWLPSAGLRPMEDVDLLVEPGGLARARRALEDAGFTAHPQEVPSDHGATRLAPSGGAVDLHTRLLNPAIPLWRELGAEDPAAWWGERRGEDLSNEAHFLLTAAHATKHWMVRDRWWIDLVVLWTRRPPEAGALLRLARAQGLAPLLRVPLALLDEVVGLPVPARLRRFLGAPTARELDLVQRLARGRHDYRDDRLARFLPMIPSLGARARVLAGTLLPGPAEVRRRFGREDYLCFLGERAWKALGGSAA